MSDPVVIKAPFVGSDGRPTIEPGAFFLDGDYSLRVNSWNALAGVVIGIRVRMIRATDGELVDSDFLHTPNSNRTKATNDFPLPAGFILNITVFASTGAPLVGQTFVQVQLTRGLTGATLLLATILQDYVTSVQALAYPGSPIRSSIEGGGFYRTITGTTPGAGLDFQETVPTGARWQLVTLYAGFTTGAAVANRNIRLILENGATRYNTVFCPASVTASLSVDISWGQGLPAVTVAGLSGFSNGLPMDAILLAGADFRSATASIAAADQWGAPQYLVKEWLEASA